MSARVLALTLASIVAHARPIVASTDAPVWVERTVRVPIVGTATAYVPRAGTDRVVLFLSGDGGWNLGVVDMARRLAPGAVVIGISVPALYRASAGQHRCWYPAGDLETIAHSAEKQLGVAEYRPPILVGYSSGATLAYAAMAAAPAGTFAGALSLGFCPDLELARAVCPAQAWKPVYDERKHVTRLPPQSRLAGDWYLLQGLQDQVCSPPATRAFVKDMAGAHLIEIEKAGHGFSRPAQWARQFDAAFAGLSMPRASPPGPVAPDLAEIARRLAALGLPLEVSLPASPRAFVVFVSGDGGWADLDRGVASTLNAEGIAVVGWSAIRYFWHARTPEQFAADFQRIAQILAPAGKPIFAGGYSFGAEVVPVALARAAVPSPIAGIVAIAPAPTASFEVDPLDWIRTPPATGDRVGPAFGALHLPVLCVRPADDTDSACADLRGGLERSVTLAGSHHFNGRYAAVGSAAAGFIDAVLRGEVTPHQPTETRLRPSALAR